MNKTILAVMLFSFCAGAAVAEEKAPAQEGTRQTKVRQEKSSWKSWYNNFYKGLRSKMQRKFESKTRVSAVAAVRGSKTGRDASELYWKGGVSEQARKKAETERKALGDAVELVVNGDTVSGREALEKFIKDNPDSVYVPDAREALEMLPSAQEEAPEAAEPPAAEAAPEKDGKNPAAPAPEASGDGK